MSTVLVAWIGRTDLDASEGKAGVDLGPIAGALAACECEKVELLSDWPKARTNRYVRWLRRRSPAEIRSHPVTLGSPTAYADIYREAVTHVANILDIDRSASLVFHLSPGTPAMAAMWILLAKGRFQARLIQSSQEKGVEDVDIPFEVSADFNPELLRQPDDDLVRLTQGLPPQAPAFVEIIHRCTEMKKVVARARRLASRHVPVLILGESGTGKELVARAIHASSPRAAGPFVPLNCGAIPDGLVDSELFGHKRGAFTGAASDRAGCFEAASGGSLFLDEIGELPLASQVRLLRVLQDGKVQRVGESSLRTVDVRIVAATNRDLSKEMHRGSFREDLFHRIAVGILQLPPLRKREGDLDLLVGSLLARINEEFGQTNEDSSRQPDFEHKKLSVGARSLLHGQRWRGNVRELLNTLQRAALWASGPTITKRDVEEALLPDWPGSEAAMLGRGLGNGLDLRELQADLARHYIVRALESAGGNKTRAAELIGCPNYQTFSNWMKKYGVADGTGLAPQESQ